MRISRCEILYTRRNELNGGPEGAYRVKWISSWSSAAKHRLYLDGEGLKIQRSSLRLRRKLIERAKQTAISNTAILRARSWPGLFISARIILAICWPGGTMMINWLTIKRAKATRSSCLTAELRTGDHVYSARSPMYILNLAAMSAEFA